VVTGSAAIMRRPSRVTAQAAMRYSARMAAAAIAAAPNRCHRRNQIRSTGTDNKVARRDRPQERTVIGIKTIAGWARVRILRLGRHGRRDSGQGDTDAK